MVLKLTTSQKMSFYFLYLTIICIFKRFRSTVKGECESEREREREEFNGQKKRRKKMYRMEKIKGIIKAYSELEEK